MSLVPAMCEDRQWTSARISALSHVWRSPVHVDRGTFGRGESAVCSVFRCTPSAWEGRTWLGRGKTKGEPRRPRRAEGSKTQGEKEGWRPF